VPICGSPPLVSQSYLSLTKKTSFFVRKHYKGKGKISSLSNVLQEQNTFPEKSVLNTDQKRRKGGYLAFIIIVPKTPRNKEEVLCFHGSSFSLIQFIHNIPLITNKFREPSAAYETGVISWP
jgi:hypothetical protein